MGKTMSPTIFIFPFSRPMNLSGFPAGMSRAAGLPYLVMRTGSLVEWTSLKTAKQCILNSLADIVFIDTTRNSSLGFSQFQLSHTFYRLIGWVH
jgi:hypothetical protein